MSDTDTDIEEQLKKKMRGLESMVNKRDELQKKEIARLRSEIAQLKYEHWIVDDDTSDDDYDDDDDDTSDSYFTFLMKKKEGSDMILDTHMRLIEYRAPDRAKSS